MWAGRAKVYGFIKVCRDSEDLLMFQKTKVNYKMGIDRTDIAKQQFFK